jgi:RNA polymerase sigma-70 factor, ECF subfamily
MLASLFARGRAAFPALDVDEASFARHLARAVAGEQARALESLPIEDLYLACACADEVPGAAAAFESRYAKVIRRAISRVLSNAGERDEAEQLARHHLLVGTTERGSPNISKYLGHGSLENWVSVAAIRLAVSLRRSESAERRLRQKAVAEVVGVDPEVLAMKGELRQQFEVAVQEALERLEDRERLVLRLYLVSGMTLAAIGKTFGVSQPTVSRWLIKARASLLRDVQRLLETRLNIAKTDLTSVARLVASQLDISLSRLLETP